MITGGSSGIGHALARECASRGQSLLLVARNRQKLEMAASEIMGEFPVEVHILPVDLATPEGPREAC